MKLYTLPYFMGRYRCDQKSGLNNELINSVY